ncbi:hypothetical protein [Amorphus sp. 3PC139-8]|uniref:hypothetical protein n=1 Tax=Amorphus sp. 3PC139-8 TaxID=2735676 RepID=UPI00345DB164
MSARLLGDAMVADTVTQTRKLVLLKLVDAADPDGTKVFPGVASIAGAALCSERQVQRVLGEFLSVGLLIKVRDGVGGRGKGRPTEYRFDLDRLALLAGEGWAALEQEAPSGAERPDGRDREGDDAATGTEKKGDTMSPISGGEKGDICAHKRVTYEAEKGDTMVSPYPLDPSIDPSEEREGAQARESDLDREGDQEARSEGAAGATGTKTDLDHPSGAGASDRLSSGGKTVYDMIAAYPAGRQYPIAEVRRAWNALTPEERQKALDGLPEWLEQRRAAKLRTPMFLQSYLDPDQLNLPRGAPAAASAKAAKPEKAAHGVTLVGENRTFKHWSPAWFEHLVNRAKRGLPIKLALQQARQNPSGTWSCKREDLPDLTVLEDRAKIASDSEEWRAWRRWFETRDPGASWPSFDQKRWFFLPSEWPPGAAFAHENPDELPAEARI